MPIIPIDDPGDARLADYRGVSDPELLRRRQRFVAEGRLVVRRLLTGGRLIAESVLLTAPALDNLADLLPHRYPELPVYVVSQAVMNDLAGFNIHRGCLAIGLRPPRLSTAQLLDTVDLGRLVVLEGVSNADNVGGIFRSTAALGGDAVLLGPHCCDPLYRKAIRTSIGASLEVPFAFAGAWPADLELLRGAGFTIVALATSAEAPRIETLATDLVTQPRVALLAGAEGAGLSPEAHAAADLQIRIAMRPGIDSLNVAVALSITLHRVGRHG
jgi:tRNA G18 (ribose-2'-O)-methylase SpoU